MKGLKDTREQNVCLNENYYIVPLYLIPAFSFWTNAILSM